MYLTRFRINTGRPGARRLLGSPHRMHGAVNMAFPESPPRDGTGPRVLWRVDVTRDRRADLLIVSPDRPDLTHLVEQAGWPTLDQPGWTTFAYGEFLDRLAVGEVWSFRLTANPVHYIRLDKKANETRRVAHVTPQHQLEWLLKRQEKAGFEVLRKPPEKRLTQYGDEHEVIVHSQRPLRFDKNNDAGGNGKSKPVQYTSVTFDGRLRITDLARFRRTLTQGLGKARAYGCGLMTLAPTGAGAS